jgi:hypothetical protein
MRALSAALVAAFVTCLSSAGPASTEETATTGIWINPELGLRGPMALHGNDRSRAVAKLQACDRMRSSGDVMPMSYDFASCLALAHVMELRPYEGRPKVEAAFLPTQDTIARFSPVSFYDPGRGFYRAIDSEFFGFPDRYLKEHGPHFARESFVEGRPWRRGKQLARWAVWAEGPEERVAGLRFVPRIRLESHDEFYSFEVWGVGLWPESGDLVLVVLYSYKYNFVLENLFGDLYLEWRGPVYQLSLLCYDPRLDKFRFINFMDYDGFRDRNGSCRAEEGP